MASAKTDLASESPQRVETRPPSLPQTRRPYLVKQLTLHHVYFSVREFGARDYYDSRRDTRNGSRGHDATEEGSRAGCQSLC